MVIKIATHKFTAGWATFGQPVPKGITKGPLRVDGLDSQCDQKCTWPDGTLQFAIVTAKIPQDDAYDILAEDDEAPPPEPEEDDGLSITFVRDGKEYTAGLTQADFAEIATLGEPDWLSGPLVNEAQYDVLPLSADGFRISPGLRVFVDCRIFKDGAKRFSVTVENVEDRANAELLVTYDVTIKYRGKQVYPEDGVKAAQHYWGQRWRHAFGADGYVESRVTFDLEPYFEAGAIPRIDKAAVPIPGWNNFTGVNWDILKRGPMPEDGQAHGGRIDMAIIPQWQADWIVHQHPMQWEYMMKAADLSGSIPKNMREPDSMLLPSLDERPTLWGFSGAERNRPDAMRLVLPASNRYSIPATAGPTYPRKIDNAHFPSLVAIPYVLTGDRYYADEMAFTANYHLLAWPGAGDVLRKTEVLTGDGEVRGKAYSLRNLTDAAAWLPDSDPMKEYFRRKVDNTLTKWDSLARNTSTPLGNIFDETDQVDRSRVVSKQWQLGALLWAVDHAQQLGSDSGDVLFERVAKFLIDSASHPDWLRGDDRRSAIYQIFVAKKDPVTKVPNYFATWADTEAENAVGGFFRNDFLAGPQSGDYPGSVLSGLVAAAHRGVPGAAEAVERVRPLTGSSNAGWRLE